MAKSELSNQRSERKLPPSPRPGPWLVFPHGKIRKFQTFYNISENPLKKSFKKFIPELSGKKFWQKNCHQGWLIVFCSDDEDPKFNYGEFFLWNPASLETIRLPGVPDIVDGCSIKDCVLSSPPKLSTTDNGDNVDSDSMVYILYHCGGRRYILIYCHPGEREWKKHEFVDLDDHLQSMLYHKGKLLVMCLNYAYIEISIQHGSDIEDAETLSISDVISITYNSSHLEVVGGDLPCRCHLYYVDSFDEVFHVRRLCFQRGIYENCITNIDVWKMDFDSMTWEEVKSMDDYVLFLSSNTQLSCLASDLGLSKGFVYYTHDEEMSMYKYDLEDESILLSLPCPNLPAPWYMPEWLMISATSRFGDSMSAKGHVSEKNECMHKVIGARENQTVDKEGDKEDVKDAGPWMMLKDDHMVWLISNYLHTLDYIHLREVSKKYHKMLDLRRSSSTRIVHTIDLSPWLVFPKHQAIFDFINPMHNNENYLLNIPELLKGSRIRFSKSGWLLLSKDKTLFFYNPFTRSTVKLPVLPDSCPQYAFTGISFSSLPTSSDCVVFAINKSFHDEVEISFIKRGDEFWTQDVCSNVYLPPRRKNVDFELNFNNPVFHNGAFYCIDLNGTLGVFKLEHGISWEILAMVNPPHCDFIYKSFLVECDGKLVSVLLGHLGKWVRIFRLNDIEMVWVEVKHLGRHMLCISNTSCTSAMAPTSRMENKIFFSRLHNEEIVYYSLETGMYHSFGSEHCAKDYRDSKENLNCGWIEPNWSETPDRYLNWLKI